MAVTFAPKPDQAIFLYSWVPALAEGDSIASYVLTPAGVTVESDSNLGDQVQMYLSGGTAGVVAQIAASVETGYGESLKETIYVPVYGPDNTQAASAEDIVKFALRPVVGLTGTPTDAEKADALEWLNDMGASWKRQGADIGLAFPLALDSTIFTQDDFLMALKTNLRVLVAEQYGRQVAPSTAIMAARGLQLIKTANLPDDRGAAEYF
jgi:hypothetical protein